MDAETAKLLSEKHKLLKQQKEQEEKLLPYKEEGLKAAHNLITKQCIEGKDFLETKPLIEKLRQINSNGQYVPYILGLLKEQGYDIRTTAIFWN